MALQPFSQLSHTPTVPKGFQIGLCGVVEAELEFFWKSWCVEFLGGRLYESRVPGIWLTMRVIRKALDPIAAL